MKRADRLDPAIGVATRRQIEMSKSLAATRQDLSLQEDRLRTLKTYLDDYGSGDGDRDAALSPTLLRERRAFVQRLSAAVRHQEETVAACGQRLEEVRIRWRECRSRVNALESAADRLRAHAREETRRREQADEDETGIQMVLRRRGG